MGENTTGERSGRKSAAGWPAKSLNSVLAGVLILSLFCRFSPAADFKPEIGEYVRFLDSLEAVSARDYLLGLWRKNRLVVLCERDHNDITQYDLIWEVVKSEYFIDNVGSIFIEVGSVSVQERLLSFLEKTYSSEKEREAELIRIYRDFTWPAWEKSNTYYFLLKVSRLNQELGPDRKILVYPVDEPTPPFASMHSARDYQQFREEFLGRNRDSVMASNIISRLERIRESGAEGKALVIMNYRHAFARNVFNPELEREILNTGALLKARYPDDTAFIYLNFVPWGGAPRLIHDGKWDAAFKVTGREDMGFDLGDSPFSRDYFDLWPYSDARATYGDYFTGMVFYLPLERHLRATGLDNYIDPEFEEELWKRISIFCEIEGRSIKREELREMFRYREQRYGNLDRFLADIGKWLDEQ